MKVERDRADSPALDSATETSCLVLMRVSQPSPLVTSTTGQTPVSNSVRATTSTVVLEKILTQAGFPHGGINE